MPTEGASVHVQIHLSLVKAEEAQHASHIKTLAGSTAEASLCESTAATAAFVFFKVRNEGMVMTLVICYRKI